jgi:hypothetical protein
MNKAVVGEKGRSRTRRAWPVNLRPGYHINTGGKLVIESKAEMAKRGVASPDDADALALTFACSVAPEAVLTEPTYWGPPPGRVSRNSWLG